MPDYIEAIAYCTFLNKEFGLNISAPEFLAEDSKWDEYVLDWYITYANVFSDKQVVKAIEKHREKFARKGIFCALYGMGAAKQS